MWYRLHMYVCFTFYVLQTTHMYYKALVFLLVHNSRHPSALKSRSASFRERCNSAQVKTVSLTYPLPQVCFFRRFCERSPKCTRELDNCWLSVCCSGALADSSLKPNVLSLLLFLVALCSMSSRSRRCRIWSPSFRMEGDEFGSSSTSSAETSGCMGHLTYIGRRVWELWPQFEHPFLTNWSESRVRVDGESSQALGFDICLFFYAIISCYLLARLVRSLWQKPRLQRPIRVERDVLPAGVQRRGIAGLRCQLEALRDCVESVSFESLENVTLSAPYFYLKNGAWQCAGYDASLRKWRRLPPFSFLPTYCEPDVELFKEYLVCSHNGIVCVNVSKTTEDRLIVFNPLTGRWRDLPPLIHRRNPVLMHLVADAATGSYQVIVAGSAKSGDEHLSRITEVFDSRTGEWKRTGDLPGPDYGLNDYQTGAFIDGYLYCIAFLDQEAGRGILRYNLSKGVWLKNWTYPIPFSTSAAILQLIESGGELYVFSEQETANKVEHCVDRVVLDHGNGEVGLNNVVRQKKMGGKSLEVYPEYTCVPFSENRLCVFNTIDHSGVVYDVRNHGQLDVLQSPGFDGDGFYSLNPMSFTIQPSFKSKI